VHQAGEFTLELDMLSDERTYSQIVRELNARVRTARGADLAGPSAAAHPVPPVDG
jgi:hypothetical protein